MPKGRHYEQGVKLLVLRDYLCCFSNPKHKVSMEQIIPNSFIQNALNLEGISSILKVILSLLPIVENLYPLFVVNSVLVGASKPEQLLDNIKACENTFFTEEELELINRISL